MEREAEPGAVRHIKQEHRGLVAAIETLRENGHLYELDGAVVYRVVAYRNAAKAVRDAPVSVVRLCMSSTCVTTLARNSATRASVSSR